MLEWYAIRVKSCQERVTQSLLRAKDYEEFLPSYRSERYRCDRVKEIEVPLFPGYIFCRFDARYRLPIVSLPTVVNIVSAGNVPISVDDEEIHGLQQLVASGLAPMAYPFLSVGHAVCIERGPLRGARGFVVNCNDQQHLVVSVTLLQRSVAVRLERSWIVPVTMSNRNGSDSPVASASKRQPHPATYLNAAVSG